MASPSFGVPGSGNNAPLPIPGNTNPTGTNSGVGFGGVSFPNYPMFGTPSTGGPVTPSANAPLFSGTSGGLANMSSGTSSGSNNKNLFNELAKAYGSGAASQIYGMIENGLFNPQVAAAFLNAMQPAAAQGLASVQNSFGAEGSRFGSAAALGIGNYESQVNLNEQQTLASMYMQAQQEQLQLLESVLPTLHSEKANEGSWVHKLIGGLEIAGAIGGAAFTGGASLALLGPGISQLSGGGGGGGGQSAPMMPMGMSPINTGTFGNNAPLYTGADSTPYYGSTGSWESRFLDSSAGADLGGASLPSYMSAPLA